MTKLTAINRMFKNYKSSGGVVAALYLSLIMFIALIVSLLLVAPPVTAANFEASSIEIGVSNTEAVPGRYFHHGTRKLLNTGPHRLKPPVQVQRVFYDDPSNGSDLSIITDGVTGQTTLYVNSYIHRDEAETLRGVYSGMSSRLYTVKAAARQIGRSRVDVLHKPDTAQVRLRGVRLIEADQAEGMFLNRVRTVKAVQFFSLGIGAFCGLWLLVIWSFNLGRLDWLLAAAFGGVVSIMALSSSVDAIHGVSSAVIRLLAATAVICIVASLVAINSGRFFWYILFFGVSSFLIQLGGLLLFEPTSVESFWLSHILHITNGIILGMAALRAAQDRNRNSDTSAVGSAIAIAAAMFLWLIWPSAPSPFLLYFFEISAALAVGLTLLCFSFDALKVSVNGISEWLSDRVRLKQAVLQRDEQIAVVSQELEKQIKRRAVLEERQRLMRDMHDGIGGQLVSLLTRARSGPMDAQALEYEIENSLNDLRLVVYSLDSAGTDIPNTLHRLEERMRSIGATNAVEVKWKVAHELADIDLPPRRLLDLNRLVQEVITNVLRHAQAAAFDLNATWDPNTREVKIVMRDDGVGLGDEVANTHGAGLKNMSSRARMLGGDLLSIEGLNGSGVGWELIFRV